MGVNKITLFVDVVSPFAYEAFHLLRLNYTLYHEFFVNHAAVAQSDVFAPIFKDVLGAAVEAEKVLTATATEGKATLTKNTDDAFAAGAFGLPWDGVYQRPPRDEGFWGVDHLGHVTRFLDLPKPGNVGGWRAVL